MALEAIIEAREVEKYYEQPHGGRIQVIAPTDLAIHPGTILTLLGPSGSGKSTLLRMLTGLARPSKGQVFWRGRPLDGHVPNVGIVFQSFALYPWLTVLENVEAPLQARAIPPIERRKRALKMLDTVGLDGFETAYPKELSGGMKQRVGFARALAIEPEVLFMDEPFSSLDVLTAENLRNELLELWLNKKMPATAIFIVTHNIEEAVFLADRIIVLGKNPGRIRSDFRVELPHVRDRKSSRFIELVDYIYKIMTQPEIEHPTLIAPATPGRTAKVKHPMLPHAGPGGVAGLLELLEDRGGREDLYRLAEQLLMEVDDILPIVEAAALLGFAILQEGDVVISSEGKAFAEADILARKLLFRDATLKHVAILQQMNSILRAKSDHSMEAEFFHDILDEHFSEDEVKRQLETALHWGRYAEIFDYDSKTGRLFLPESPLDGTRIPPTLVTP
jgi:NitT/TauT family transport system ATP-binding protein